VGDDPLHMAEKEGALHARRETAGGVMVFIVENPDLYAKQADELGEQIGSEIESADRPAVLVDLSGVRFVCSALIGRLIDLHKRAKDKGGTLKLCVTGEHVEYSFKLVHLHEVIEIGRDRRALLDAFAAAD
jgi:anti-anti-sigma factor